MQSARLRTLGMRMQTRWLPCQSPEDAVYGVPGTCELCLSEIVQPV